MQLITTHVVVASLMVLIIMVMWRWEHRCWYNVFQRFYVWFFIQHRHITSTPSF